MIWNAILFLFTMFVAAYLIVGLVTLTAWIILKIVDFFLL